MGKMKSNNIIKIINRCYRNHRSFVTVFTWIIIIFLIALTPMIFTRELLFKTVNFLKTGQIGDTIGGITAPFINLLAAFLVYRTLRAQIKANDELHDSNKSLLKISKKNNELMEINNLKELTDSLMLKINSFHFSELEKRDEDLETKKMTGPLLINSFFANLFKQTRNHHTIYFFRNYKFSRYLEKNRIIPSLYEIKVLSNEILHFAKLCKNSDKATSFL